MNEHLSFHYGEGMVKVDVRGTNPLTLPLNPAAANAPLRAG
jgi:hypothetical protein